MYNAYLQITNMPGESTDSKHKDWIELQGYEISGMQQQAGKSISQGGALSAGRSEVKPFKIRKLIDKASPKIMEACLKGTHIEKITLSLSRQTGSKSGATEFYNYTISQAMVVGFTSAAHDEEESDKASSPLPYEEVEFVGVQHKWTYTETDTKGEKKGNTEAQYSMATNS